MQRNPEVLALVAAYPPDAQNQFDELHKLLLSEAERLGVDPLRETLKWGQPSYITPNGEGTTVRLHWSEKLPDAIQILVHCQTSLVETWRQTFDPALEFEGNRAIHIPLSGDYPKSAVAQCLAMALTYHKPS